MSASRKRRIEASERACSECQSRKTRCIIPAGGDTCTYCFKKGKECVLYEKPERTPLTRKNLDAAEARCRELESMLRSQPENTRHGGKAHGPFDVSHQDIQHAVSGSQDQPEAQSLHDMEMPTVRSNEWQEHPSLDESTEQDGMASFAAPSKESGYLGSTSGSSLLRSLSMYLSPSKNVSSPKTQNEVQERARLTQKSLQVSNIASSKMLNFSAAHDFFVDAYFIAYNSSYPIVHERTFRAQCLRKAQMPPNGVWHVIYYMVLAIGEWISGHTTEHHSLYYEAARSRLNFDLLESGNMGIVQALLLLGNYLQKRDRPNTAYNFIGIAYRVALGLGLHRELPLGNGVDPFLLQQRRLLFWTLYSFDSGFSMTTGRPILVSDTFIDIRKPTNIDETMANTSPATLHEVDYPTSSSAIIAQSRLAVIANKVYSNFLSVRACLDVEDLVATMELTIRNWRNSLPWYFFDEDVPQWFLGPRQVLLWKEANLQIALLLASQRNHVEHQDKMSISDKCQIVAIRTVLDISQFCIDHPELIHIGLSWYAVYFLLHGILALGLQQLMRARQNKSARRSNKQENLPESTENAIAKARECLQVLGRTNKAALRTLQIVDRIEETLTRPAIHTNSNNNSTPQHLSPSLPSAGGQFLSNQNPSSVLAADLGLKDNHVLGDKPNQNSTALPISDGTSPEGPYANCIMNEWVATADPSLHFFFDNGTAELDNLFDGMQGFPNVLDADNFGYVTSTMHSVRLPGHHNEMPRSD